MPTEPPEHGPLRLTWVGHSTVLLELDGVRVLTDPLLRTRVAHLRRIGPVDAGVLGRIDAVLVSHGHYDHLDVASLRRLDPEIPVVAPHGLASIVRRSGHREIREVGPGDEVSFGGVLVRATPAEHPAHTRIRRAEAVGFVLEGSASAYFAGDTDLFEGMAVLAPVTLALLPVWGWGPSIGPGHLDPQRAARAVALLRATVAVPIHWGTYYPLHQRPSSLATEPPVEFERAVAETAPETRVELLEPGGTLTLPAVGAVS